MSDDDDSDESYSSRSQSDEGRGPQQRTSNNHKRASKATKSGSNFKDKEEAFDDSDLSNIARMVEKEMSIGG